MDCSVSGGPFGSAGSGGCRSVAEGRQLDSRLDLELWMLELEAGPGAVDAGVGVGLPAVLWVKCTDIRWGFFVAWSE